MKGKKMKKFMKALGFLALVALAYLICTVISGAIFGMVLGIQNASLMGDGGKITEAYLQVVSEKLLEMVLPMTILINCLTIGAVMLFFLGRKDQFVTYIRFKKIRLSDAGLILALGVFVNLLLTAGLHYFTVIFPGTEQIGQYEELMETVMGGGFLVTIITIVIVAPLFEEILIRGIIFNDFKKAVPVGVAIVIQALVFGAMHGNLIQGTYGFILGLLLGVVYLKYKSIWASILLHFAFNATPLILGSILPESNESIIMVVFLIVGLVGTGLLGYITYSKYDASNYPDPVEPVEPVEPTLEENYVDVETESV